MTKRLLLLLAAALLAGPAALAQVPAVVPPVPDADRVFTYSVNAATSIFAVPFPVYGNCTDLYVTESGQPLDPSQYTCSSASGVALTSIARPITDLQITLVNPLASGTLTITSLYRPRNLVVPTAPGITRTEFERTINGILSGNRDLYHAIGSVFPAPAVYGVWNTVAVYPQNAVVGYNGLLWQASQPNTGQPPIVGSSYWTLIPNPVQTLNFSTVQPFGTATPIAAASVTDLGTVPTHVASVTGAATITSFGSSALLSGPIYFASFAAGEVLAQNATSLILPGGANITTAAGDTAILEYLGSGNWQVLTYNRASVAPGFPSGAVMAFNLATCPIGWVASDGTNGTADLRGVAVRGLDNGRGLDAGRALASYQADQLQSFNATYSAPTNTTTEGGGSGGANKYTIPLQQFNAALSGANFGAETRMKNVALLYCQKS